MTTKSGQDPVSASARITETAIERNATNDKLGPLREISAVQRRNFTTNRSDSIIPIEGREGILIAPKLYKGQTIAIYTSGGDASGS